MKVSSCCCCFSLKTGCIIISAYYIIVSLLLLVSSSMDLYGILTTDEDGPDKGKDPIIRGMLWTFLLIIGLHVLVSFVLLAGAKMEVPAMVLVWIIANIVFLVAVVSGMSVRLFLDPRKFLASIGKRIFSIIIGIYFLIVVKSFHTELKERQANDAEHV
ncbi:uncharacterized protein LOC110840519 isoform X3 [Zootermopsis nevadensis]|uniref:Transmembrane protein n=1 Tax=Zootermopsis nevadensis TaxID=136037 RepID=A0A067QQG0_ZOONE|nr:uncharacterized protein LOC110840519 isoform X3 [Zootermopsis nevadensis]KDR06603.1 hypothetical protein L798_03577 [Zootermopsis nevadensis]